MKKIILLLIVFVFAGQGWGQEKDLSKVKNEYPNLQKAETSDNFITFFKNQNSSKLEAILQKSVGLNQSDLKIENIESKKYTLELNRTFYLNGLTKNNR